MVERTLPKPDTRVRFPSAAPQAPDLMVWGFYFLGWMRRLGAVGRVEAVCSLLLQGTRPRFASDTLMSRRNIPASPLLTLSPSPGRWSSGCGCAVWNEPRALGLGRVCAEAGRGNTGVRYRRQLAGNECWVQGIAVTPYGGQCAFPKAQGKKVSARPFAHAPQNT